MKRYINNILTNILTLTLLLFAGANFAWGQVTDGYYYIANYKSYNASDHTKSYYICPAINPNNTSQAEYYDTDMPFLTTFKTNQNDESLWLIKWVKDEGGKKYYNIIHAKDGYYLVYNPVVTPSNNSRLRVHIQFTSTNDDNALFEVKSGGDYYYIHPKKDINRSLNPSKGNKDSYVATDESPVDGRNIGGMIGLWEDNEDGRWYLETPSSSVTVMPVVTNNFDGTITITAIEGKIYYATSRTAPTIALTANDSPAVINLTDEITVIRAIAKTDEKEQSAMANYVLPKCVTPVITESEGYITIECAAPNATIYYTTDGSDPCTSNTRKTYLGTFQIPESSPAVRVVAKSPGYTISEESYYTHPALVHSSTAMTIMSGNYILAPDFVLSGSIGTESTPFEGIIDGQLVTLQNKFEYPLVAYAKNATIKNVIVGEVGFSVTGDAGAVVNVAQGNTHIYNCGILSGSVSGTGKTGSIVGNLQGYSRVINCYSFANVSGGDWAGGIVGYNSSSSTTTEIKTMVMNCMFYGNITGGTKKSPIYGGTQIDNLADNNGLNNYNYYAYNTLTGSITNYNTALAAKEEFLVHFELYRQLLNSNRKLASWYATGSTEKATEKICKWVLDKTIAPYPILKPQAKYSSIINYGSAPATPETIKELSVTITGVGSTTLLPISDKDPGNYNYNYHKVQLPYYNDFKNDNYKDGKVVTGWMVTSLSGAFTIGEGSQQYDYPNYNLADRNCTKDAEGNYRVFSQGAYFNVPIGVSSITIAPKWANAVFVADEYYDVTYKKDYSTPTSVDIMGKQFPDGIKIGDETYEVYTSISSALGNSGLIGEDVYENAVVLVGNVHLNDVPSSGTKPFTLMSIDLDKDNEPDYSLIYSHYDRKEVSPIRFDFLNIIGTAMAQKPNTASSLRDVGIFKPKGWFEITNTATIHFGQFEYDYEKKTLAPLILLGGHFDQIVSNNSGEGINYTNHTEYIHVGSNVWFKEFHNGTHADKTSPTPHRPISVTGGYYGKFYLSGMYQPKVNSVTDNAVCYIDGGQFGETAGAGQEQIKGNVTWKINYADITNFYGGGINAAKAITGNITTYIDNSNVDVYCGGPKFGDMADNTKLVKTVANKCEFRRYFGAGYGGASFYRNRTRNEQQASPAWSTWTTDYTSIKGEYDSDMGIAAGFDYEYFVGSKGTIWGRLYVNYASFSKAKTYNVTSELTDCHITGDFYGGGSLGVVDGLASSTLDGCTVDGSVYGGGYSASIPTVDVMSGGFATPPSYNSNTGVLSEGVYSNSDPYTWKNVQTIENNSTAIGEEDGKKIIKTTESLNNLGQVKNVNLIIKGNSHIKGDLHTYDGKGEIIAAQTKAGEGGVFGGGDESSVSGDTFVTLVGNAQVDGNVFGGGNKGFVSGNSTVKILDTVPPNTNP